MSLEGGCCSIIANGASCRTKRPRDFETLHSGGPGDSAARLPPQPRSPRLFAPILLALLFLLHRDTAIFPSY